MLTNLLISSLFAAPRPFPKASPPILRKHVQTLADNPRFRNYTDIERLNESANYIKEQLIGYGYNPEFQKYEVNGVEYGNVIARIGSGNKNPIILGAHYDVCYDTPGAT